MVLILAMGRVKDVLAEKRLKTWPLLLATLGVLQAAVFSVFKPVVWGTCGLIPMVQRFP